MQFSANCWRQVVEVAEKQNHLPDFGHSTFSAAATEVLSYLFPADASYFASQRDEAALSRLYGGIHYPSDINVGKDHGARIGDYTVRFAQTDGAN